MNELLAALHALRAAIDHETAVYEEDADPFTPGWSERAYAASLARQEAEAALWEAYYGFLVG